MSREVQFQGQRVIELQTGNSLLRVSPEKGGRLLMWEVSGKPVIHWPENADWSNPPKIRGGNPILFPFIARHFVDGQIGKWKDTAGVIRDLPMHGFARAAPFTVVDDDPSTTRMRLVDNQDTQALYPYAFVFDVVYELDETSVRVVFETVNKGNERMPYYAGHHFYFPVPHDEREQWELHLIAEKWARQNDDGSIVFSKPNDNILSLADPDLNDRMHILGGVGSVPNAELRKKDGSYKLLFDLATEGFPWYAVTTWTQTDSSDFYCVEPWLGLPNAIHHHYGLRWIEPGQKETAGFTLRWLV
ncbi:MAG: aldose epimerase [Verrucomicrobiota bacterium]